MWGEGDWGSGGECHHHEDLKFTKWGYCMLKSTWLWSNFVVKVGASNFNRRKSNFKLKDIWPWHRLRHIYSVLKRKQKSWSSYPHLQLIPASFDFNSSLYFFTGIPRSRTMFRVLKQDRSQELTPKHGPGRKPAHCPEWVVIDIRQTVACWYVWLYKEGRKEGREYPTIKSVREKFYEIHSGAVKDPDISMAGEIPLVGISCVQVSP